MDTTKKTSGLWKVWQVDSDHAKEYCSIENKGSNCQEDHLEFLRFCCIYNREKEIIEIKYKRNISFSGAIKNVKTSM